MTFLDIDHEGKASYTNPRSRKSCGRISSQKLDMIREILIDESFLERAKSANEKGTGFADYEEVGLTTTEWSVIVPRELAPPEMLHLLEVLADAVDEEFAQDPLWSKWSSPSFDD